MKETNQIQKMNSEAFKTKMKTIFYNMDIKNNICADCGKNKSMDYASINNGIIICSECAKEHEKLGYNISFIRSLGDKWDDYLFNYLKAGGNSRFIQFCKDYKVDKGNNNIIQKYKSKGLTYYRDIIRSEVLGYDPPDNINVNKAYEEEPEIPDNYPEFKKYSFVKHVDMNYLDKNFYQKKEEKQEDEGFFGKLGGFWGNVKKKIGDEADDLMKKVSEIDYSGVKEIKEKSAYMFGYFFGGDDKEKIKINEEKKILSNKEEKIKEKEEKKDDSIFKSIFGIEIKNYFNNGNKKEEKKIKIEKKNKDDTENGNIKINDINNNKIKEEIKEKINEKIQNKSEIKEEITKELAGENIQKKEKEEIIIENIKSKKIEINENLDIQKINESKENSNNLNEKNNLSGNNNENDKNKNEKKENNQIKVKNENMGDSEKNLNDKTDENIEDILKDNNYNNDNSQMNNEEKDELEKMLKE